MVSSRPWARSTGEPMTLRRGRSARWFATPRTTSSRSSSGFETIGRSASPSVAAAARLLDDRRARCTATTPVTCTSDPVDAVGSGRNAGAGRRVRGASRPDHLRLAIGGPAHAKKTWAGAVGLPTRPSEKQAPWITSNTTASPHLWRILVAADAGVDPHRLVTLCCQRPDSEFVSVSLLVPLAAESGRPSKAARGGWACCASLGAARRGRRPLGGLRPRG